MPGRILIIRGGAIGDFILTMPAIRLLKENLPDARIEILGYPSIAQLALGSGLADTVHSIEYAPLARFFSRRPTLDPAMVEFFTGFQQVISYLYDPDGIFEANLRTAGVKNLLIGPGKLSDDLHAAHQLARPLEQMAFFLDDPAPSFVPSSDDSAAAKSHGSFNRFIFLHPGSGGKHKVWPVENWIKVVSFLKQSGHSVALIGGEADRETIARLRSEFDLPVAQDLPLRTLGALLSESQLFIGHDSGISHLAAATGINCLLLFGPTDPDIWAPLNRNVETIISPDGTMAGISLGSVVQRVSALLQTDS